MTLAFNDLRFAVRGLFRSPLFSIVAILSLALGIGANTAIFTLIDQILLRKLPVKAPDELVMLYQNRRAQRQQHGHADALVSDVPGVPEARGAARRGDLPPAHRDLGQHRQPDRAARYRAGVWQLLFDARRRSGARPRLQLPGGRSGLQRPSGRRAQLRLLDAPLRARPGRRRQEDPGQQFSDDDRRRLGGGFCRSRSRTVSADSRADPDEAGGRAGMVLGLHGKPADAVGAGVRAAEAGLDGEVGGGAAADAVSADAPERDDAARRQGLVAVRARSVHEGPHARRGGRRRLLEHAQRFFDAAARADVHGRPGAADRLRQRREPADRARLHAAEGNRGAAVDRRLARTTGAADAGREPGPVGDRRRGRRRVGRGAHQGIARVRAVRRPAADAARHARCARPRLHPRR